MLLISSDKIDFMAYHTDKKLLRKKISQDIPRPY